MLGLLGGGCGLAYLAVKQGEFVDTYGMPILRACCDAEQAHTLAIALASWNLLPEV